MKKKRDGIIPGKTVFSLLSSLSALILLAGCVSTDMGGDINLPPLLTRTSRNPVTEQTCHWKALGPLLEFWKKTAENSPEEELFFAFRPLASFGKTPGGTRMDLFWPLSALRQNDSGSFFWFFPYFHANRQGGGREIFLFPFLYWNKDHLNRSSFFLFPLYGKLQNGFAGKNTDFILFPLYVHTRQGVTESHCLLWPFILWEKSPRHRKMRVFPLAAYREQFGLRKNYSILWPLVNFAFSADPSKPGFAFLSFPLGGYESWGKVRNGSILWPFFSWQKSASGINFNGPWPFFRYGKGKKGASHLFLWPLAGNARMQGSYYAYFLWPAGLYLQNKPRGKGSSRFLCMLPIYLSHTENSPEGKLERSYRHIYPFFSRYKKGEEVFQKAPDLTPIRRSESAERNLQECFTLFKSYSNKRGLSWEILWGMARSTEAKDYSLLAIGPFYMHRIDKKEKELFLDIFFGCVKVFKRDEKSCVRLFHLLEIGHVPPRREKGEGGERKK